jgi:hypothetical protein
MPSKSSTILLQTFRIVPLVLLGVVRLSSSVAAEDTNRVAILYQRFLSGQTSQGYVAFRKEFYLPGARSSLDTNTAPRSTNVEDIIASAPNVHTEYRACWWNGSNFVMALTIKGPVGVDAGISAALVYGFDGDTYWEYRMPTPPPTDRVSQRTTPSGAVFTSQPPGQRGRLSSSFTAAEVEAARAKSMVPSQVSAADNWMAECRRVTQFGLGFSLDGAPQISGSTIVARMASARGDTQKLILEITGAPAHPDSLKFSGTEMYRVLPDFSGDSITIDTLSKYGHIPSSRFRYHILEFAPYAPANASGIYSPSTYQAGTPDLKGLMDKAKAAAK